MTRLILNKYAYSLYRCVDLLYLALVNNRFFPKCALNLGNTHFISPILLICDHFGDAYALKVIGLDLALASIASVNHRISASIGQETLIS